MILKDETRTQVIDLVHLEPLVCTVEHGGISYAITSVHYERNRITIEWRP